MAVIRTDMVLAAKKEEAVIEAKGADTDVALKWIDEEEVLEEIYARRREAREERCLAEGRANTEGGKELRVF